MTYEQKQCILKFFGCYDGIIDSVWGPASIAGTKKLQKKLGITEDGDFGQATEIAARTAVFTGEIPGVSEKDSTNSSAGNAASEKTGTFWDEIEFFGREEFRCQCGGKYCNGFPVEPQEKMVRAVDEIRRRLGVPVSIVDAGGSGVRCPRHNAAVGGVANSNHLYGKAADLHSEKSPQEMHRVAEEVMGNTGEIGIYDWGIHVGVNCKYSRFYG